MPVQQLHAVSELEALVDAGHPLVLGFVAEGCGPCLQQRPVWSALPETVVLVDVDRFPEVRTEYGVEALPTTVVIAKETLVLRGIQTTRQLHEALGTPVP